MVAPCDLCSVEGMAGPRWQHAASSRIDWGDLGAMKFHFALCGLEHATHPELNMDLTL